MKLKKTLTALAVASALMGSTAASASISLTNLDGTITNWTGIDWNALGSVAISGFIPTTGSSFTSTFWSTASLIYNNGVDATGPGLDTGLGSTGNYEYTIFATLNETNSFCSGDGSSCSFQINSGAFSVYYDTTPDGNYLTGAGITDGDLLFSGVLGTQPGGSFTATSPTDGFGVAALLASINYTNPLYIAPDLSGSNTVGTLQIGGYQTAGWTPSTSMPGAGGTSVAIPEGSLVLQADMNSGVRALPEPASLALMGIGLMGLLGFSRRKSFKK